MMTSTAQPLRSAEVQNASRSKALQLLGILSGFTAGAWLGAAEAPTKLVSIGISPIAISLIMVIGVFLARWSLPALILGVVAVAFSSASGEEQTRWKEAARREGRRYGVARDYVGARMDGRRAADESAHSRSVWDWLLVAAASAIFVVFAGMARVPQMSLHAGPAALLIAALLLLLFTCTLALWRTTRFN